MATELPVDEIVEILHAFEEWRQENAPSKSNEYAIAEYEVALREDERASAVNELRAILLETPHAQDDERDDKIAALLDRLS